MRKIWLIVALFIVVTNGCKCKQEPSPEYMKKAELAGNEYTSASERAGKNDPAGYLKLYEMARNDDNVYPTDWQEVSKEKVFFLLYLNTELWVTTFSKVDSEKFKDFVKDAGIEVSRSGRPKGVSNEQFKETIFINLRKFKGDKKEIELVDYVLGLYGRKRR